MDRGDTPLLGRIAADLNHETAMIKASLYLPHKRHSCKNVTGLRYGRLTAIHSLGVGSFGRTFWRVKCDCGKECDIALPSLTSGDTKSCGCLSKQRLHEGRITHGLSGTPEHRSWENLKGRCSANGKYVQRGIKVCSRWLSFENFIKDMGLRPSPSHTIDRIDNNGDYCPENCRWATKVQQSRNTRRNRFLTIDGETKCIKEWSLISGISEKTIACRVKVGKSHCDAVFAPLHPGK